MTFNSIDGTSVDINGDVGGGDQIGGAITVAGDITNDHGRKRVGPERLRLARTCNSLATSQHGWHGRFSKRELGRAVRFSGILTMTTGSNDAFTVTSNTGTIIDFSNKLDIDTTSGTVSTATGGGTLTASATTQHDRHDHRPNRSKSPA